MLPECKEFTNFAADSMSIAFPCGMLPTPFFFVSAGVSLSSKERDREGDRDHDILHKGVYYALCS